MNRSGTRSHAARTADGFTTIELIVAMIVIGILIAVAVPRFTGVRKTANKKAVAATAQTFDQAIRAYMLDHQNTAPQLGGTDWTNALEGPVDRRVLPVKTYVRGDLPQIFSATGVAQLQGVTTMPSTANGTFTGLSYYRDGAGLKYVLAAYFKGAIICATGNAPGAPQPIC